MKHFKTLGSVALAVLLAAACGESAGDALGARADEEGGGTGGAGAAGGEAGGTTGGEDPFIPEEEIEVALQAPQGGDKYVFVVSTGLDAVVRIDALSLEVDLIEVGGAPTVMRTMGGEDSLVVFNRGTRDFSVVRAADGEADQAAIATLDAPSQINRLEVAAGGAYAVAWYDPEAGIAGDPVGDLQQVLVLGLTPGAEAVYPVGVGFHPLTVSFRDEGDTAYVVTEDGISVIDMAALDGPSFVPTMSVTPDPFEPWFDREVLVTPDGARAVVRRGGVSEVRIITLASGDTKVVELDGPPTDVDLTPDATEAIVVVRDQAQLVRVLLEDPGERTTIDLSGTPAGLATLTDDGQLAVLYSTLPEAEWLAVLDLATGEVTKIPLKKGVTAVAPAPDSKTVLVLHQKSAEGSPDPTEPLEDFIDKSEGYSVVDIETLFAKLELLDSPPGGFAVTPDGGRAYVLVPDVSTTRLGHFVDDIDLRTMLVTAVPLGSPPRHAVYVPAADRMAVSQDHPVGRITFIDTQTGDTETVTGFELNGLIE